MAKIPTSIQDIHALLEQADYVIKRAKRKEKQKKKTGCKNHEDRLPIYKGLCQECLDAERNVRLDEKVGKRWFSTNGHEYCYNSEGKPVQYSNYRMTQLLGRPLQEYEMVVRIDGNKQNNEDSNLVLTIKPGVNLLLLRCSCGLSYLHKEEETSMLIQDQEKSLLLPLKDLSL